MTHKKFFITAFAATLGVLSVASAVQAHEGPEGHTHGQPEIQRYKLEERKAKLNERINAVKEQRTVKLAEKRLQACEKREAKVNQIVARATTQNEKQLAVIKKIQEKVVAFYTEKKLTSEAYELALSTALNAEIDAKTAIDASRDLTFDCETTDAANPGSVIKAVMIERHTALRNYRTAVKDLILVVKNHNGQNRDRSTENDGSSGTEAAPETETETETETTTGGEQ